MLRRRIAMVVLGLGALWGFASGFHSLRRHARDGCPFGCRANGETRQTRFEDRIADVCLRAAERQAKQPGASRPATVP